MGGLTRAGLDEIREQLYDLGVRDRMAMLARREFVDLTEAMEEMEPPPSPASDADVQAWRERLAAWAVHMRTTAESKRGVWPDRAVERWLRTADEIEGGLL